MEREIWRQCVRWLIDTGVLPSQHKTAQSFAVVFDLAQTLRDGVVLCNLLNLIKPGAVDFNRINLRPQMLQFLCMQNIRTVLHSLSTVFKIHHDDLFQPEELFEMTNFPQVLRTLSVVSYLPVAHTKYRPFPENARHFSPSYGDEDEEEDIYRNLPDLASERELADEEELYDSVAEDKEEGIYGSLIAAKPPVSPSKDKRSFCVNEIMETERNYVSHLKMISLKFIEPLKNKLDAKDLQTIFINSEQLLAVHRDFLNELERAKNEPRSKLSSPFVEFQTRFLIYGTYCSRLTEAQERVVQIMDSNLEMMRYIEELQIRANPSKFKLRELLCVPMQRVLKYHLLVKELHKQTSDSHPDKKDLAKALQTMQELSHYVNEVKRDSEMLVTINKVSACLTDYTSQSPLSSFGRLLKDGELKIKSSADKNPKQRNTFLFDQALFMTKSERSGTYSLKDLVRLQDYRLENKHQGKGGKWSWQMTLISPKSDTYYLYAKTEPDKSKWIDSIQTAFENLNPSSLRSKQHSFVMKTFNDATYCSNCEKLLLGSFFQGYQCQKSGAKCHKECLSETLRKIESNALGSQEPPHHRHPSRPLRKYPTVSASPGSSMAPAPQPRSLSIASVPINAGAYRAHRDYNGDPPPPFPGASTISFAAGEQIEVTDQVNPQWWVGMTISHFDRKGYFPASHVSPMGRLNVLAIVREMLVVYAKRTRKALDEPVHVGGGGGRSNRPPRHDNYLHTTPVSHPRFPIPSASPSLPRIPSPTSQLENQAWYAGEANRGDADNLLQGKPTGTFLVRTRDGHMAISLMYNSELKHIKINKSSEGLYYVAECKNFRSVQDLIRHYQENTMSTSFLGLETTLKIPYRDPNFFPSASGPPPLPTPRPVRPSPPDFNRSSRNHHVDQVVNGVRQITVNGKTYDFLGRVRVCFDFDPRSPQEIGLRQGQVVNVVSKAGDAHGWWKGECEGRVGYFPSSFITELD